MKPHPTIPLPHYLYKLRPELLHIALDLDLQFAIRCHASDVLSRILQLIVDGEHLLANRRGKVHNLPPNKTRQKRGDLLGATVLQLALKNQLG